MIESAKVTFSKMGVHCVEGHVANIYTPRVSLQIEGRKSAKTGYLQLKRFDKQDYQGLAILPDFIVIITTTEYITVGEDAEERKSVSRAAAGEIVDVQEEGFICRIGNRIQLRNIDCEVLGERELTEEEQKELDE